MKNEEIYKTLYKKVSALVNLIDPAALGGAINEYDREVNQIIKLIMFKKRPLTIEEIKSTFTENYESISLEDNELESVVIKIKGLVKDIYPD